MLSHSWETHGFPIPSSAGNSRFPTPSQVRFSLGKGQCTALRSGRESNSRIEILQISALPLGHRTVTDYLSEASNASIVCRAFSPLSIMTSMKGIVCTERPFFIFSRRAARFLLRKLTALSSALSGRTLKKIVALRPFSRSVTRVIVMSAVLLLSRSMNAAASSFICCSIFSCFPVSIDYFVTIINASRRSPSAISVLHSTMSPHSPSLISFNF